MAFVVDNSVVVAWFVQSQANAYLSVVIEFDVPIFTFRDGVLPRLRCYCSQIYARSASLTPTPH